LFEKAERKRNKRYMLAVAEEECGQCHQCKENWSKSRMVFITPTKYVEIAFARALTLFAVNFLTL